MSSVAYMAVITTLHKCKQCGKTWFHPVRPNICPNCKTSESSRRVREYEFAVSGQCKSSEMV